MFKISLKQKKKPDVPPGKKMYNVVKFEATMDLVKKPGCSKKTLKKIINKGAGAYFSSGSRPNQTAQSWGIARLASALTSGKAAAVDYNILIEGCKIGSKGYKSAKKARKKHGYGSRRVPKTNV